MAPMKGVRMAVVGAGAAGSSLARALSRTGIPVVSIISRSIDSARRLAAETGTDLASDCLDDLRGPPDLLVLAVPDDEIGTVANDLASRDLDWSGSTVAHLSGSLPSSVLAPLQHQGAEIMSFHPMISLHPDSSPDVFVGAWVSVEGSDAAAELARVLGDLLGARVEVVSVRTKALLHLAAALASNYLVTLMSMGTDVLEASGLDPGSFEPLLRPLVAGTLGRVDFRDPASALTGPISRADKGALRRQLDLISEHLPGYMTPFAVLAAETVRIALKTQKIGASEAAGMLDLLQEFIDADVSGNAGQSGSK